MSSVNPSVGSLSPRRRRRAGAILSDHKIRAPAASAVPAEAAAAGGNGRWALGAHMGKGLKGHHGGIGAKCERTSGGVTPGYSRRREEEVKFFKKITRHNIAIISRFNILKPKFYVLTF